MSIYVNFERPENPKEFLKKLYSRLEEDRAGCVATYYDKDCTSTQCYADRLRSFDDLFVLFTTYYPELTEKDLIEILSSTVLKSSSNRPLYLHVGNCGSINRIRIFYYIDIPICALHFNCSKYDSKYSWVDLFKMININSGEEYTKYLKNLKTDEKI